MYNRRDYVLKLIVEYFVKTAQPVGSKTLIDVYNLDLSSATIRNEMQSLENDGFLEKTHTSSGRVPSSKGYEYYISHLREKTKDSDIKYQLQTILNERTQTIEEMIHESCEILSEMTNLVSVVLGNTADQESLASLQFIPIGKNNATVVFVTSKGSVESRTFFFKEETRLDDLAKCIDLLNKRLIGTQVTMLVDKMKALEPIIHDFILDSDAIYQSILKTMGSLANDKVVMYGKDKLFNQPEFANNPERIKLLMDLFDSNNFAKEINDKIKNLGDGVSVKVCADDQNNDLSIVSAKINIPGFGENVISLVGPKRMNYEKACEAIETLVNELNDRFDKVDKENK